MNPLDRATVTVTQPYVPAYRKPLFDAISRILYDRGARLQVLAGAPRGTQARRGDVTTGDWLQHLPEVAWSIGRREVAVRRLPELPERSILVSELSPVNTIAWLRPRSVPFILWGHGKSYVSDGSPLSDRIKWVLAHRADHVMTYSDGGRDSLVQRGGISPERVTAIGNSTDTELLRSSLLAVSPSRTLELRTRYGHGPTALFVGGLDASKRIEFLLAAAKYAHDADDRFRLIIVGKGELGELVRAAAQNQFVHWVPEARGETLAELATVSDAVWMPGRVGLVAVDAMALGLPLHTVSHRYHAPEIEFLSGRDIAFLPDEPRVFALNSLMRVIQGSRFIRPLEEIPTIGKVSESFVHVVEEVANARFQ